MGYNGQMCQAPTKTSTICDIVSQRDLWVVYRVIVVKAEMTPMLNVERTTEKAEGQGVC